MDGQIVFVGKGVFATKDFQKGDFLLEYRGERITRIQYKQLEEYYTKERLSYVFEYHNGEKKEQYVPVTSNS